MGWKDKLQAKAKELEQKSRPTAHKILHEYDRAAKRLDQLESNLSPTLDKVGHEIEKGTQKLGKKTENVLKKAKEQVVAYRP